ncbi:Arginyl-tRNA--protein transferase 1 [Saxophila tyrrhenica]|uniref:Arginyl-tRNA--protein transferase 1 n=1 Tax=Saxophila tyrrhenica TaxID=1690608 RepID=A0AAV9PM91_9PEZI|nr:Arginyl-tRNA--protein transferase 1 [Saxophila tyrrhenica]
MPAPSRYARSTTKISWTEGGEAREFQAQRDQRQALHRWNRYVLGEEYIKEASKKYPRTKESVSSSITISRRRLTSYREKKRQNNNFDLLTTLHEAEQPNLKPDIKPAHTFTVTLEPDTYTEEKFTLFSNYQSHVHKEQPHEISRTGFRRFLCSTPLHNHPDPAALDKKTGSFHQLYRLDGRLIALSVLDLLPGAVSGVYFIYHSDFEAWSFGKLSALRETALALEGGYEMYYMGYFIHSCKKMAYKGDYRPQNVLDYDTGEWDVMDSSMRDLMGKRKWVSMSRERRIAALLDAAPGSEDTERELVDHEYRVAHPTPTEAMNSGKSLLELHVPGALAAEEVEEQVDLDDMKVTLGGGTVHRMRDIVSWAEGRVTDSGSIMGIMAELAACVGPKVAGEAVVDLGR